jgi:type I restriction enzyme S subunit
VDELIVSLEKLIAKKRDIKIATMQQLLTGNKRLKGFSGQWKEIEIGAYIDLLTGYPFPSSQYAKSGIKLLRGSNIKRGETDWNEDIVTYWHEITLELKKYELKVDDIVIAMDGSLVGRSFAQLKSEDLPSLLLQRVARVRSTSALRQQYLKEWICSQFFTEHCDSVKTVTAIPHISPEDIRTFKIKMPEDLAEQDAISKFLSDISIEIVRLEKNLQKNKSIKQGMMQELLTGRTRLIEH